MPTDHLHGVPRDSSVPAATTSTQINARSNRSLGRDLDDLLGEADTVEELSGATPLRRDFNLIRLILIEAEQPGAHAFRYEEFDRRMIQRHLVMLIEAGYLHGNILGEGNGLNQAAVERLTWAGHDLLSLMRDGARWNKAATCVLDPNGRAHLETLVRWLSADRGSRPSP